MNKTTEAWRAPNPTEIVSALLCGLSDSVVLIVAAKNCWSKERYYFYHW